jgi:HlyD family secretion protein
LSQRTFLSLRKLWPLYILVAAIVVFLLLLLVRPRPAAVPAKEASWNVKVQRVTFGNYAPNVLLYGKIESPRFATLKAAIEADVVAAPIREGQYVKKGQLLVQLDDREVKYILQQRESELASLRAQIESDKVRYAADQKALEHEKNLVKLNQSEVDRRQKLRLQNHLSQSDLEETLQKLSQAKLTVTKREQDIDDHRHRLAKLEADYQRQLALVNQAKLDVERTQIRSPFDGRITKLDVSVGNRVRPGDTLIEMFDTSDVEVRAQIPQHYLHRVRLAMRQHKSMSATSVVDGVPIKLQLVRLAGSVAQGRSGVDGLFKVVGDKSVLEVGRTIEILLTLPAEQNVVRAPVTALYGLNRAYLVKQNRLQGITVKRLGTQSNYQGIQQVLIKSPKIKEGDLLLITHIANVRTGLKVVVVD